VSNFALPRPWQRVCCVLLLSLQRCLCRCSSCCRYLFLNSLLNLLNRWALGLYGLRFPLIMTASHMIFGSTALAPMMLMNASYAARHASVLSNDWKGLATIAVMNGFQIACNNASLTVMELSMNQVIRASIPVIVAMLAVCIEGKVPSKSEVLCLIVISMGVMLAVWEESRNAMLGIVLTLISTVMQSIQMSLSGKVMSGRSGKLDSFQMTFYTGPVAFVSLAPFALTSEYTIFAESLSDRPLATGTPPRPFAHGCILCVASLGKCMLACGLCASRPHAQRTRTRCTSRSRGVMLGPSSWVAHLWWQSASCSEAAALR
jgi:drug/metabolite transporter (DMT)-like permease